MIRGPLRYAAALSVWVAAAPGLGCGGHGHPEQARAHTHATVAVSAHRVAVAAVSTSLVLPARVAAHEEVAVRATWSARLTSLPYGEGRSFPPGATLARFEAPETRAAVSAAQSALEAADLRRGLARRQAERMDSLFSERVASLREVETAREEWKNAEASRSSALAAWEGLRSGTEVRAPFGGVVVRHRVDAGAVVAVGEPLLDIRSRGRSEIVVAIPERWVGRLNSASAFVRVGNDPWRPVVLDRIDGMTDSQTRTKMARFRAVHSRHAGLDPGAFVEVRLESGGTSIQPARAEGMMTSASQSLTIPTRSLVRRGSLTGVYVIRDGRAWLRWIRPGRSDSLTTTVLSGLLPGEEIALDVAGLEDGRPVTVRR